MQAAAVEKEMAEWAKIDTPSRAPEHGYSMAAGKKWGGLQGEDRGATGEKLDLMKATPPANTAGAQPFAAGIRPWAAGDPRLAPGGLLYEVYTWQRLSPEP